MKFSILAILFSCCAYVASAQITVYDINKTAPGKTSDPHYLTPYGGKLYCIATDSAHGYELWGIDSVSGEFMVGDINPGLGGIEKTFNGNGSYAVQYVNALNTDVLFFTADDGVNGNELFMYDGVSLPSMAKDLIPGSQGLGIVYLMTAGGGYVFFYQNNVGIWQYNVNTGDVKQIPGTDDISAFPGTIIFYNGWLYAAVYKPGPVSPYSLWKYNPVTNDTSFVKNDFVHYLNVLNNRLYFWGNNSNILYEYDAVNSYKAIDTVFIGLTFDAKKIGLFNNNIYYAKPDKNIYEYNPNTGKIRMVIRHDDYWTSFAASDFTQFGDKMYFAAGDLQTGRELWEWDGTNPPKLVADIQPGSNGSYPFNFHALKDGLYFVAGSNGGQEVHRYKPFPATVQNLSFKGEVRAYPNPTASTATLELQLHTAQTLYVELYNTEGRKVLSVPPALYSGGTSSVGLDMRHLPVGNYFYHVRNKDNATVVSGKLVRL